MNSYYTTLRNLFKQEKTPKLILDIDRLESNLKFFEDRVGSKQIRIATKSVRSSQVLQHVLQVGKKISGLMTYSLQESLNLHNKGFQDILMGYPSIDEQALMMLCNDQKAVENICLMIDSKQHIEIIEKAVGNRDIRCKICIDIDMSSQFPAVYFGVRRSPVNHIDILKKLLDDIQKSKAVKLVGIMGYEAQIAGLSDYSPHRKFINPLIRFLKKQSIKEVEKKRQLVLDEIKKRELSLSFVNAGGSGSYDTSSLESGVTEITVGSGLYCSHLFDYYKNLSLLPALFYTLQVSRIPTPQMITCQSGGFIASGVPGLDKQPKVYLPEGLIPLTDEGFGEVQTPFKNLSGIELLLGDPLFVRHAKAGEICEHFNTMTILRNQKIYEVWQTYRGEGNCYY